MSTAPESSVLFAERNEGREEQAVSGKIAVVGKKATKKEPQIDQLKLAEVAGAPKNNSQVPVQQTGDLSRFQELPEGFEGLADIVFESEDQLDQELGRLGLLDEPIVLGEDGKAYCYMPGDSHNVGTGFLVKKFHSWSHDVKGVAGENTNVVLRSQLLGAPPPRKRRKRTKRLPDVAIWGRSKCELDENGHVEVPLSASPPEKVPKVHPHVVIQLSVFNDEDYEIDAVNDLANRATVAQGTPPNLAILIKTRAANAATGVQAGLDIYYMPNGTFFHDAQGGTNGARHVVYNDGGPDVMLTITETDLGGIQLTLFQSIKDFLLDFLLGGSRDFELSMAQLFRKIS